MHHRDWKIEDALIAKPWSKNAGYLNDPFDDRLDAVARGVVDKASLNYLSHHFHRERQARCDGHRANVFHYIGHDYQ
jgi:hypothetical protein